MWVYKVTRGLNKLFKELKGVRHEGVGGEHGAERQLGGGQRGNHPGLCRLS